MNCHYCFGVDTFKEELTEFCSWRKSAPLVVENIPALVCIQCSETIFPGKVNLGELLDEIRAGRVAPTTVRAVPFYDFQQARPSESPQTAIPGNEAPFVSAKALHNDPPPTVANVVSSYQFQSLPSSVRLMYGHQPMPGYQPYTAPPKDLRLYHASSYADVAGLAR